MKAKVIFFLFATSLITPACQQYTEQITLETKQPVHPLLSLKEHCTTLRMQIVKDSLSGYKLKELDFTLAGTTDVKDIIGASLFFHEKPARYMGWEPDSMISTTTPKGEKITFELNENIKSDTLVCWLCLKLKDDAADANKRIQIACTKVKTSKGLVHIPSSSSAVPFRMGVALRQSNDDGVFSSRIPGLVTTTKGTLIAMYDARNQTDDDLQGDIDIAINRSEDGGHTWHPIQRVLNQGNYGNLPKKYNGVSDGNILVDQTNGDIYIAGLWMHGVLDPNTQKWVKELNDTSTVWNHQWRTGSKAGYDLTETCQFLISKSTDDGLTWSTPRNLTREIKKIDWWLLAPAPGRGITMEDGTLVMPIEGRNETGRQFSTIMWSRDKGETWTVGEPAFYNVNECQVVELGDHTLMLNMRKRDNRGKTDGNGRAICVTSDMGKTWTEHTTSQHALIEPACQGGFYRHNYVRNGEQRHILLFTNPNHNRYRIQHTLKVSFDDGGTWPEEYWMLLDEDFGAGYSCITSIDEETIGIFYEGSQADIQFQAISLKDILKEQSYSF